MSKTHAPAFQFYPIDFLHGSKLMTLAERGAYITLLCEQWDEGGIVATTDALKKRLGLNARETEKLWKSLASKFVVGSDGLVRNLRLERERKKQERFRRKQRQNGRLGGRPAKNPGLSSGLTQTKATVQELGKPKKSPSSSSSDLSTTPPNPPATQGGATRISRRERQHAEHLRRSRGGCFHEPRCPTYEMCLKTIVLSGRALRAST